MKIAFMTGLYPKDEEQKIIHNSIGMSSIAANRWSWSLLNGLDSLDSDEVVLLNSIFIGDYPKGYRKMIVSGRHFSHRQNAQDIEVGFINIFGIKHLTRAWGMSRVAKRFARSGGDAIIVYSMNLPFVVAALRAKRANPNLTLCLIALDLPEFMRPGEKPSPFRQILNWINRSYLYKRITSFDCYVTLTAEIAKRINGKSKPSLVIEGIVDEQLFAKTPRKLDPHPFTFFYAGGLKEKYGINTLVQAFMNIQSPNAVLQLCGSGESEDYINKCVHMDPRIQYMGVVDSTEVVSLQMNADLIVNPRVATEEFTKYSFPSKNMEAMASGTPLLGSRLPGIPSDYYEYFFAFDDYTVGGLSQAMQNLMESDPAVLQKMGARARSFVLDNKNAKKQAQVLLNMIRDTRSKD